MAKKIAHQGKAQAGPNDRIDHNAATAGILQLGTLIAEIQKNSRERLRISTRRYKGYEYVDVRVWYVGAGGEYLPSVSGVMLKPTLVPQLMQALGLVARAADPRGAN